MNSTPREDLIERLKDTEYRKAFAAEDAKLEIAALLYKARKESNLTQQELSKKLKISQPYIAKLEAGEANPTIGIIGGILGVLGFKITAYIESVIPKSSFDSYAISNIPKFISNSTITSTGINQDKPASEPMSGMSADVTWYPSFSDEERNVPECVVAGGI